MRLSVKRLNRQKLKEENNPSESWGFLLLLIQQIASATAQDFLSQIRIICDRKFNISGTSPRPNEFLSQSFNKNYLEIEL